MDTISAHIIDQLLCRGFRVRGTARSQEKLDHVRSKYPDQHKLELAIVEDVVSKFAFDNILRGASAVIHGKILTSIYVRQRTNLKSVSEISSCQSIHRYPERQRNGLASSC
jgi:nucleoside-diphosphate-sugar epimerase